MASKEMVVDYYDNCEHDYRLFWDLDHSLAMHAGYWDETTRTLREALARENAILATLAGIKPHDRVLDAGCGIGGSAMFLAKHYGCHVTGITLSAKQQGIAQALSAKSDLANPPTFLTMDFAHTTFADASFDVVWGLESICHAPDKKAFMQEAYRILKPGGRIIIADGFQQPPLLSCKQEKAMSYWLSGWGVAQLATDTEFQAQLKASGFTSIAMQDITNNVLPSSRRLFWISLPALVFSKFGQCCGLRSQTQTNNIWAAFYQYRTLKQQLWRYLVFLAKKGTPS
jgi:tocopherol O-methyltransferase